MDDVPRPSGGKDGSLGWQSTQNDMVGITSIQITSTHDSGASNNVNMTLLTGILIYNLAMDSLPVNIYLLERSCKAMDAQLLRTQDAGFPVVP